MFGTPSDLSNVIFGQNPLLTARKYVLSNCFLLTTFRTGDAKLHK